MFFLVNMDNAIDHQTIDTDSLVEVVKEWVKLDNQIRVANKKIRELKNAKKQHNATMIHVMKANEIDNFDLKDGQIRYKKEVKREPLSQKKLLELLTKHPQLGEEQAKHLNQYVYDSRKVTEKEVIVRKINDDLA